MFAHDIPNNTTMGGATDLVSRLYSYDLTHSEIDYYVAKP